MIQLTTTEEQRWGMALDALGLPMLAPVDAKPVRTQEEIEEAKEAREAAKEARREREAARAALEAAAARQAEEDAKPTWKQKLATFLTSRFRDVALASIVVAAFVAVFDGSLYSATIFSFISWSAYAFAVMPDALMVLSAAKMREQGITPTQHEAARKAMRFGLGFSLLTNMIAAALRNLPALAEWTVFAGSPFAMRPVVLVGAVAYHGVVVLILKHAVETLTKVRADRKGPNVSEPMGALAMLANVAKQTPKALAPKASGAKIPAQKRSK